MKTRLFKIGMVVFLSLAVSGCTFIFQAGRRSDTDKIKELSEQLNELERAKRTLENRLGQEIQDQQVSLQMRDKGLVITVVGDLLFDSGKADIRAEANNVLDQVGRVLREDVSDYNVGIEGHTDNIPIQYSGWKSNWELSSARALSVLHYLQKEERVAPQRLSAIGYGEFSPVSDNDTKEGRQLNRRVEIVILPEIAKSKDLDSSFRIK
ncbi:MAG: OmpA family protein [Candidatus Omnitrophica bacterium]|nr:OmpA family protein [Candidatus Omnitrophota bacterium]